MTEDKKKQEFVVNYTNCVKKYLKIFGVRNYRATISVVKNNDEEIGSPATVDIDPINREMHFTVNMDSPYFMLHAMNEKTAEAMAFHEVMEAILTKIHHIYANRTAYSNDEVFSEALVCAVHDVIVTFENAVLPALKEYYENPDNNYFNLNKPAITTADLHNSGYNENEPQFISEHE